MSFLSDEQYYRAMLRTYEEFKQIATRESTHYEMGDQSTLNAATKFFTECYHFKDYLKQRPGIMPRRVEQYVSRSKHLSLAADICNTIKHANLSSRPRSRKPIASLHMFHTVPMWEFQDAADVIKAHPHGENVREGDQVKVIRHRPLRPDAQLPPVSSSLMIDLGNAKLDALKVAERCIGAWNKFLKTQNLDFSKP
jgi:hypothetical protein